MAERRRPLDYHAMSKRVERQAEDYGRRLSWPTDPKKRFEEAYYRGWWAGFEAAMRRERREAKRG